MARTMQISSIASATAPAITAVNQIAPLESAGLSTTAASSQPPLFVGGLTNWSALLAWSPGRQVSEAAVGVSHCASPWKTRRLGGAAKLRLWSGTGTT